MSVGGDSIKSNRQITTFFDNLRDHMCKINPLFISFFLLHPKIAVHRYVLEKMTEIFNALMFRHGHIHTMRKGICYEPIPGKPGQTRDGGDAKKLYIALLREVAKTGINDIQVIEKQKREFDWRNPKYNGSFRCY